MIIIQIFYKEKNLNHNINFKKLNNLFIIKILNV